MQYRTIYGLTFFLFAVAAAAAEYPAELETAIKITDEARLQFDPVLREQLLGEAEQLLGAFAKAQPDSVHTFQARQRCGNILIERARMRMQAAPSAADPVAIHTEARAFFNKAELAFSASEAELIAKLVAVPKVLDAKKDGELIERRDQYRADYLQTQLLIALTKEEMADTYPKGDPEAVKLLEEAGKRFGEYYEKYRTRVAGLYGRLYQARVLQKLDKHKESLAIVTNDLLVQPDEPAVFRTLKVKAVLSAIPSWTAQGESATAVVKGLALIDSATEAQKFSAENQELRYHVARAIADRCDELGKQVPKDEDALRDLKATGKRLCEEVRKTPNDWNDQSRPLLPRFAE